MGGMVINCERVVGLGLIRCAGGYVQRGWDREYGARMCVWGVWLAPFSR